MANKYDSEIWRIARYLLREKTAGIGAPLIFSVGLAMIYGDDFILGINFVVLAGAWGIGAWLVSEQLRKHRPQPLRKLKYAQIQKYNHARRRYLLWKFSIPGGIVFVLVLSAMFVNVKREEKILREYQGFLLPANEPDSVDFCGPNTSNDGLKIFIGMNEAIAFQFPYTVLQVAKKDRIVIDRDASGKIALSVDILDSQEKVLATFEKGHFTVVQANILDMKRPDRSTLVVRDQYKNEVLLVHYINKQTVYFSGLLRYAEGTISIPWTPNIRRNCVAGGRVAYAIN